MRLQVLDEVDADAYRSLRLSALQINPEAFGSTYEREVNFSIETVAERLKPTRDKFVLGAIDDRGSLVGMATFVREASIKMAHKGNIYGVFIAPEVRGQGIGKSLMVELIRKAKQCDGLEQIHLTVVSDNEAAQKLYKSLGFQSYGVEPNALKYDGRYYDEDLMVLRIQ